MKPLRTALFAPGIKDRVMMKALDSGADAVIFDLEDSVPAASKAEARKLVSQAIADAASRDGKRPAVYVRINAAATRALDADLSAVVQPGLDGVFLPKAESIDDVLQTAEVIERCESTRGMTAHTIEMILMIESALGVYRCYELLQASPRVASACIGGARDGDLQADLACSWSIEGTELMYARSKVLLDTRAAGKPYPLDGVYSDLEDEEGLRKDTRLSARLGYVGRTVIHPKQIAPVRESYAIPEDEVRYYREVVAEFEAAEKAGTAAIVVAGKLVDYAMYARAKRVLALAELDR